MRADKLTRTFKDDFELNQINELLSAFRELDTNDKGWIDERTAIDSVKDRERKPYDNVRTELKAFANPSGQVDQEDYIKVSRGI